MCGSPDPDENKKPRVNTRFLMCIGLPYQGMALRIRASLSACSGEDSFTVRTA